MSPVSVPDKVRILQEKLRGAAKADPRRRFHSLRDKVYSMEVLSYAWRLVRENGGAPGVDGVSIEQIEREGVEAFLARLQVELRTGSYEPAAVRRVMIPKPNGGERPLGIPTVRDRVAQAAVKTVLEPVFEADFLPASFGFRPGRSALDAVREVQTWLTLGLDNVLDADVRKCFDEIPHDTLMEQVKRRITDGYVLKLIRAWLLAPVVVEGLVFAPRRGTPQGGVLSPLLANVHLHALDEWATEGDRRNVSPQLPKLVRYADDFVMLSRRSVRRLAVQTREFLASEMGLTLHEEKSRVVHASDGFNFLGYRFVRYPVTGGHRNVVFPSPKSLARAREEVRALCGPHRQHVPPERVVKELNAFLVGWVGYFGHFQWQRAIRDMQWYVNCTVRRYLRQRTGKAGMGRSKDLPDRYLHEVLGLVNLERTIRQRTAADNRSRTGGRRAV